LSGSSPVPILLAIHSLGHGGSERQLANIALAVDRTRFSPHVASVLDGFQAEELRRQRIPAVTIPLKSFVSPGALSVARQLRSYIQCNRIRLVHTFDYTLSLFGIPVARTCSGVIALSSQRCYMDLVPRKYKWPLLQAHRMAHGVVVNCGEMRRHLVEDYSYPENRVTVCYNGLDISRFSSSGRRRLAGTENASLVIGTVCVLRAEKNVGQLLEAFAQARKVKSGMKLVIVGNGPERDRLGVMSAALGLAGECLFLPSTPDVASALRGIDIFVHPSVSEGLPNAVMEAMACGCAVVATRVGGCPELIHDGKNGFLADPRDLTSLTQQLQLAISQDDLRMQVANAAAERMQDFSLAQAAARMQQIYESYISPS
jgi:L-malate glycosyltransferase